MRHLKLKGQLGLVTSHREALLRNLLLSLLKYEHIQTTIARAKQLKRYAEPILELGKKGDLWAKRQARRVIHEKEAFHRLFEVYGPRLRDRQGGYIRIFYLGRRHGDNAQMSLIEILPEASKEKEPRIIKLEKPKREEGEEGQKGKKEAKKEDKHLKKQEAKTRDESKKARQTKDVPHSHISQGRKTEKGTGRTQTSKKGLT